MALMRLSGSVVLLLREKLGPEAQKLKKLGSRVLHAPLLRLNRNERYLKSSLVEGMGNAQWIVFTSASGVFVFYGQVMAPLPASSRIACVGPSTAKALSLYFKRRAHFIPSAYTTRALGKELPVKRGDEVFLVRSGNADTRLDDVLKRRGARVRRVSPYHLRFRELPKRIANTILKGKIAYVFFGSRSQVDAFFKALRDRKSQVKGLLSNGAMRALAIGPETAKALRDAGVPCRVARPHTFQGLIELAAKLWNKHL